MSHPLHRRLRSHLPEAVSAHGLSVSDRTGKVYLDVIGGASAACLGHNHPEVLDAMARQLMRVDHVDAGYLTTRVGEELAEWLVQHAPRGMSRVFFVDGAAQVMESAMIIARQYCVGIGQPQRRHFIARRQSHHGNSLGALSLGGAATLRAVFAPLLLSVSQVAPCHAYRGRRDDESPMQYGQRLLREIEAELLRLGPDTVIGICLEPVAGMALGAAPPVPGYFQGVRSLCDRYGVLLIADESVCGLGRTGSLHALDAEGVVADLQTLAHGLGAGHQTIGAVMVQRQVEEGLARAGGHAAHGLASVAHPVASAAALAVQQVVKRDDLVACAHVQGMALRQRLDAAFGAHPHVGDIRGRGLLQAIELVSDRADKQCFEPALALHERVRLEAMELGLLVDAMGGTVDGVQGDHVMLAPPYTVTADELDLIVARLSDAVSAVLSGLQMPHTGAGPLV